MKRFSDLCDVENIIEIDKTIEDLKDLIKQGLNYKRRLNIWFESDENIKDILTRRCEIRNWYNRDKKKFNTIFELGRDFNKQINEIFNEDVVKSLICNGWCENNIITYNDFIRYHYYTSESDHIEDLLSILEKYNFGELIIK